MTRHTRGNIPPKWPILANKAWMKKRVIDEKLSDKDIADLVPCSWSAVRYWRRQHGFLRRVPQGRYPTAYWPGHE